MSRGVVTHKVFIRGRPYRVPITAAAFFIFAMVQFSGAGPFFESARPLDLKMKSEPFLCVPLARQAPVMDGRLDDPAWQSAACITSWIRKDDAMPTVIRLSAMFIADSSNLYVGMSVMIQGSSNANLKAPAG